MWKHPQEVSLAYLLPLLRCSSVRLLWAILCLALTGQDTHVMTSMTSLDGELLEGRDYILCDLVFSPLSHSSCSANICWMNVRYRVMILPSCKIKMSSMFQFANILTIFHFKKNASAVFHKNRYLLFLTTDCKKVHTVASLLHYPRGIYFKTPSRCLKLRITPNSITLIFFPCAYILFYLKKALYGFYLAYLNCQHHYSCALGHY